MIAASATFHLITFPCFTDGIKPSETISFINERLMY